MQDFHFTSPTGLKLTWRGASPADAIVRFGATCLPDTRIGSPVTCHEDRVTYHLSIENGYRIVRVIQPAMQFNESTLERVPDALDLTDLRAEIKAALEGDSNDAEHDALVSVADRLGVEVDYGKGW